MNFFAKNLRYLRKEKRWSQEELAVEAHVTRGNIASYELGNAEPNIKKLQTFAELFGYSLSEIIEDDLAEKNENGRFAFPNFDANVLKKHFERSFELRNVVNSFNVYHRYKIKSLDSLPKDLQMMIVNFEELFEVTSALLKDHEDLLEYLNNTAQTAIIQRADMPMEIPIN